jgi:hypothetical protein
MKTKGKLAKYFTTLSRDNGRLFTNCTWLDPWVTAKMLLLLFAPAIRSIVEGTLALEAAAAARALLQQSQEEAEVQDAVEDEQEKWDAERAARRKEKKTEFQKKRIRI